jgi:glycosyltransferase involved in cell wall biosynthesis
LVTTDIGGTRDYAIHGKTALVSAPEDSEALAQNIIRLIENEDERRRIAENGYNYIKQFTWDRATDQLEEVFKKYV